MSVDIASAGKAAVKAGTAQLKTFVVPIVIGTFAIMIVAGFVPQVKKLIA